MKINKYQRDEKEQRMQVLIAILVAVLVALGASTAAAAEKIPEKIPEKPILVLESHVGARPVEVGRVMDALRELLEPRGFAARPASIQRLVGTSAPRPGVLDPELTEASIAQHLSDGWAAFVAARWEEAVTKLTQALREVHRNPALIVNDAGSPDRVFKAYVALAVSQQRRGDVRGAVRAMTEVIRIFPSRPVPPAEAWGRDGEKLHGDMTTRVRRRGPGRLSIASGQPGATIFVDDQMRGMGSVQLADLVPGLYRVFIRLPGSIGRQYEVVVAPNEESRLDVDLAFDMSAWVTDSWVGLQLASEEARAREGQHVIETARRWIGRGTVVVLSSGQHKGRSVLVGARYRDGLELRRARIYSDDAGGAGVLAQFLVDGTAGAGLEVLTVAPRLGRRAWRYTSRVMLGAGALMTAGSFTWYLAAPDDDHKLPAYTEWKLPAVLAFSGSSLVMGVGLSLYLHESFEVHGMTATALGLGIASLLSGAVMYSADTEPYAGPYYVRERYRNTGPLGIFLGCTGLVLTGAAVWYLGQEYLDAGAPVVAVERGGGLVGWTGRF
jgi:hypothetical protein